MKVSDSPRDLPGAKLLDSAQRQLDALRGAIDARLAELESALDDPSRAGSLAGLVLELSRLATSEAQAAATRACLQVKHDGEAALLEAEARSANALAAERKTTSDLRKVLESAQKQVDSVETERHTLLQAAHEQRQLIDGERSARSDQDRTISRLEHQLKDTSAELQEAHESTRRMADDAAGVRQRSASLEQELREAQQRLVAEQNASKALAADRLGAGERIAAFEQQFLALQQQRDAAQRELTSERAAASALADAHTQANDHSADLARQLAEALGRATEAEQQVASARDAARSVDGERLRSTARVGELEVELEAERAAGIELRSAQATAQAAHEALIRELAHEHQRLAELERAAQELQRAHGALQAELQAERASAAEMRGAAAGSSEERTALVRELERMAAAKMAAEAALAEERSRAGTRQAAGEEQQTALAQAQTEVQAVRADLTALNQRLAAVEALRAGAEETAVESELRVGLVERERDALSLALDTERMNSVDLRAATSAAEQQVAEANGELDALREQLAQLSLYTAALPAAASDADEAGEETELRFDEDLPASQEDGAIALEAEVWETLRLWTRYCFTTRIDLRVNGIPGVLSDLSVGGCGLRTSGALEVGERVRVELPGDPTPLLCVGQVVWVQKDLATDKAQARCRAGIQFAQANEAAIEAFIIICADV